MNRAPARLVLLLCLLLAALPTTPLRAAALTGGIEGTVVDARTGQFLENARLSLAGSPVEAFTDQQGRFRLSPVPAGEARVTVFYTEIGRAHV